MTVKGRDMAKDMDVAAGMAFTGKLAGNEITFNAGGVQYTGTVSGNTISGTHDRGGSWSATRQVKQ
jgi:hypothetical protein